MNYQKELSGTMDAVELSVKTTLGAVRKVMEKNDQELFKLVKSQFDVVRTGAENLSKYFESLIAAIKKAPKKGKKAKPSQKISREVKGLGIAVKRISRGLPNDYFHDD